MIERNLSSSSFLPRTLAICTKDEDLSTARVGCTVCRVPSPLETGQSSAFACKHFELCNECREYQIEKLFRCSNCCQAVANQAPGYCSDECGRRELTTKSTALCCVCKEHLQKECKTCKKFEDYKAFKKIMKKQLLVLVRAPDGLSPNDQRPCSHYALCKHCNVNISRGHKGNSICRTCRTAMTSAPASSYSSPTVGQVRARVPESRHSDLACTISQDFSSAMYRGQPITRNLSPPAVGHEPPTKRRRLSNSPALEESFYNIPAMQILQCVPRAEKGPLTSSYLLALATALCPVGGDQHHTPAVFSLGG